MITSDDITAHVIKKFDTIHIYKDYNNGTYTINYQIIEDNQVHELKDWISLRFGDNFDLYSIMNNLKIYYNLDY